VTDMEPRARPLQTSLPLGRDPASVRRRVEVMEQMMEGLIRVPVIGRKVGLDAVMGLVPVAGDIAAAAIGAWLVWEARNLGLGKWQLARMSGRVVFDTALGAVPLIGDAADFFYRSNTRNLQVIKRYLDKHHPATVTVNR
jgi:hypothetical protein